MATFKDRFPSQDLTQIFVACSIPVHVWAVPNMLRDIPSWLLYMKKGELLGAVAYSLTFILVESLIVFALFLLLGTLIPRQWVGDSLVPFSVILLIGFSIIAVVFQHLALEYIHYSRLYLVAVFLLTVTIAIFGARNRRLQSVSHAVARQLTPLTFLYVIVDIFAVFLVIARNV